MKIEIIYTPSFNEIPVSKKYQSWADKGGEMTVGDAIKLNERSV